MNLRLGDCLEVLRTLPAGSVDAVVTDPPYGLAFMGKRWDYDVPSVDVWAECLRVLKPGAHLLAFAGTRTQHRMAVRIEDAGFEIRDMIAWVYGSGFPKSRNLDGEWAGWGAALKPALEPITVARKPLAGTVAENVLTHGTGAINVDGCRVPHGDEVDLTAVQRQQAEGTGIAVGKGYVGSILGKEIPMYKPGGRWPANLIHDGSDEVVGLFPGNVKGQVGMRKTQGGHRFIEGDTETVQKFDYGTTDTGSAARFFYTAKASRDDRDHGNTHPTVKPTDLMRYLCWLVTPPGGIVLDPFMGSGSTIKAALSEGFRAIGIERDPIYYAMAERRLNGAQLGLPMELL